MIRTLAAAALAAVLTLAALAPADASNRHGDPFDHSNVVGQHR